MLTSKKKAWIFKKINEVSVFLIVFLHPLVQINKKVLLNKTTISLNIVLCKDGYSLITKAAFISITYQY